MKKNIFRLSLLLFVLLLTIVPSIARASSVSYTYNCSYLYYSTMKNNGELQDISGLNGGFSINQKNHNSNSVLFVHMSKKYDD